MPYRLIFDVLGFCKASAELLRRLVLAAWMPYCLVFDVFGFCVASAELLRSLVFASWMPYRLVFASCGFCGASAELLRAFFVQQVSLGKKKGLVVAVVVVAEAVPIAAAAECEYSQIFVNEG